MSQQHQSRQVQQIQPGFAVNRLTALHDDVGDQRTVVRARHAQRADGCRRAAETKKEDLNANDIDQAAKIIAGTARSMGITVE